MEIAEKVWLDGQLVAWAEATTHVSAHAIQYGSSVFEGIRAYNHPDGAAIFRLQEHIERLWTSAKLFRLPIPYSQDEMTEAICETIRANRFEACYVRPVVFRGSGTFSLDGRSCPTHVSVLTIEMGLYLGPDAFEKGVRVGVSSWRRLGPGTSFPSAKIGGQYVNSQFIAMEAHDQGFDEAIALDAYGNLSEGSGENLMLIRSGVLYTPAAWNSILEGITRRSVLSIAADLGLDVRVEAIPRDYLHAADEVFLVGTAAEISPVVEIDGLAVGDGRPGEITKRLLSTFLDLVQGRAPDRHGWLTHV